MPRQIDPDTWLDREEAKLDQQFAAEMIDQEQYDRETIALRAEYREMVRERDAGDY